MWRHKRDYGICHTSFYGTPKLLDKSVWGSRNPFIVNSDRLPIHIHVFTWESSTGVDKEVHLPLSKAGDNFSENMPSDGIEYATSCTAVKRVNRSTCRPPVYEVQTIATLPISFYNYGNCDVKIVLLPHHNSVYVKQHHSFRFQEQ